MVYPEGTVTDRADRLPMDGKTGTVRLSLASGVPIIPMASWGSQSVWQKSGQGQPEVRASDLDRRSGRRSTSRAALLSANDIEALRAMTVELMAALTVTGRGPAEPLPEALGGRRVGWSAWPTSRTPVLHEGGPRSQDAVDRPGDPERADLPDVYCIRFADSEDYADTISFRKPGYTYTRGYGNPTPQAFEALMADLEGTEGAFSFASGMAAMHTVFTTLAASGDRIVSSNALYGGAYSLATKVMPRYGVARDLVDRTRPRCGRRGVAGRRVLLRRDDRQPERDRGRPGGARRALPGRGRARGRRQHVRLALPVQPRRGTGSTTSCTRRRSTSAGTTT